MSVEIQFLGASGTVTGSKYLISTAKHKILVDVGLFQGDRNWREKNWDKPPLDLSEVDAVLVTHAHIDHIGMLPRFHTQGLKCPVYMSEASSILSNLLLVDSGRLQEEEADYRRESHKSRHKPPLPLYTEKDAIASLRLIKSVAFSQKKEFLPGVTAEWRRMGHIAGAANISLEIEGKKISFSGDVGRYHVPILKDPEPMDFGDLLLIESTYGDRVHEKVDPKIKLAEVINETYKRKGIVLIPSFAVGRVQQLLFYLRELKEDKLIPDMPIVVDSPMAAEATAVYNRALDEYDEQCRELIKKGISPFICPKLAFTKDRSESIKLNGIDEPMILISASGMLSGGRILHHLKHRIADPRNTLLFVGFQPPGSRGAWIKSGAPSLRLFGQEIPIRAQIEEMSMLSAHADREELFQWCASGKEKPGKVAIVHGEPGVALHFSQELAKKFSWNTFVPKYLDKVTV